VLLAFSVLIHVVHAPYLVQGAAAAAVLAVLLYYRDEFYAVGDPRTRWRAVGVFAGLVVADVAIGLTYILLARHLALAYSIWQRTEHVIYGLVGVSGPIRFVPDARADLFNLLTSTLGVFTLVVTAYLFLRPAEPRGRLGERDSLQIRDLLARYGDRDSLGYFALRHDKSVIWSPSGKSCIGYRVVSGSDARQRRPDRGPGGVAGCDTRVPRRGGAPRLGARRDGVRGAGSGDLVPRG
jgi:lysyl-tRNA synthetase class 2